MYILCTQIGAVTILNLFIPHTSIIVVIIIIITIIIIIIIIIIITTQPHHQDLQCYLHWNDRGF